MHAGVGQPGQVAVTGDAWLYANAEAAPKPAPSPVDAMTYHSIYADIKHQQPWSLPGPTEPYGE